MFSNIRKSDSQQMELDPELLAIALEPSVCELVSNEMYSDALNMLRSSTFEYTPTLIKNEALCYFHLKKYLHALEVLKIAEEKGWCLPDILMLKGQCLYFLEEWETALLTFESVEEIRSTQDIKLWINRCKAHMQYDSDEILDNVFTYEPLVITDVKKEWYQTAQHVCVRLFVKEVKKEDLEIIFNDKTIDVKIKQKRPIIFHMNLSKEIIPNESTFVINNSSVELMLKKLNQNSHWETCEIVD